MDLPPEWESAMGREREGEFAGSDMQESEKRPRLLATFVLTTLAFAKHL
jgi:hypothetical protein